VTFGKALRYFLREAGVSLVRSWKVSVLAVLVITVSLFVGGVFLVVAGNLARVVERARDESRVVVYFAPETGEAETEALASELAAEPWVASVRTVSAGEARRRFVEIFPSLADLVAEESGSAALPPSLEILLASRVAEETLGPRLEALRARDRVAMVDDDRDWVAQLSAVVAVVRGLGLGPEVSSLKIWGMEVLQRISEFALDRAEAWGTTAGPIAVKGAESSLAALYYGARLTTIGGGRARECDSIRRLRTFSLSCSS